jgi:cellulose synthase/poly-beta-1,6-N-acetylglucosamine synthase-like glycosyltransferase
MLSTFLNVFFGIIFVYFFLSVLYLFILSVSGKLFYKKGKFAAKAPSKKIAIFIPAYKEDSIIVSTANSMLRLNYPGELYDVYILADSFHEETLSELRTLALEIIEVKFEKSTKAKALNAGFNQIKKEYDIALICDADNVLAKGFLRKVNNAFNANAKAIQGQRVAKNMDTSYAILDTISEGINNHIFRKGTNAIGLSSAVIGSGMAFEYNTVKKVLGEINAVGGFDRPLQLKIVKQGIKIEYLEDALIFDEKVDSLHAFKQQRKRWLSSQLVYLKEYFVPGFKQLLLGNLSYFNLAVINSIIMPRVFLLLLLPLLVIVGFFINNILGTAYALTWILFLISMLISLPEGSFNKNLFLAILKLPSTALAMFSSMIGIKSSNKTFIHTTHSKTEVTNPLFEKYNS